MERRDFKGTALLIIPLLWMSGCIPIQTHSNSEDLSSCPDQPQRTLNSEDVKPVNLNNGLVRESGRAQLNTHLGYSFEARKGTTLHIQTKDNICIWVYAPNNEIIVDNTLTQDGIYVIQIAALERTTTFSIELGLNESGTVASELDSESPTPSNSGVPAAPEPETTNPVQPLVSTQRVQFQTGSTGTTLQGTIAPNQIERYELWCKGGQHMLISINGDINLVVYSPQGRSIGNLSSHSTQWQGQLPSSGDYIIEISATHESTYSFEVSVL